MNQTNQNKSGTTSRRKLDETYKRHAVELTLHVDRTVKTVAKELVCRLGNCMSGARFYAPRPGDSAAPPQALEEAEQEIARLRSEVIRMREREVVLKKSLGILSETPKSGMPRLKR